MGGAGLQECHRRSPISPAKGVRYISPFNHHSILMKDHSMETAQNGFRCIYLLFTHVHRVMLQYSGMRLKAQTTKLTKWLPATGICQNVLFTKDLMVPILYECITISR